MIDGRKPLSRRDLFSIFRRRPTPPVATVHADACLTFQGRFCDLCGQVCPEVLAIQFNGEGHPRVNADHCTGCGECVGACPTTPPAIRLTPARG